LFFEKAFFEDVSTFLKTKELVWEVAMILWVSHFGLLREGRLVTSFLIGVFLPSNFHISFLERSINMGRQNSCMC
jgi:hypothetical protein